MSNSNDLQKRYNNRAWFEEVFHMISAIQDCTVQYNKIIPYVPASSNIFAQNTLIFNLFIYFKKMDKFKVWNDLQTHFVEKGSVDDQLILVSEFSRLFRLACNQYFYEYLATEQQKEDHASAEQLRIKRENARMYRKWLGLDESSSYERITEARDKFERRLIGWTFLINDMDLMENAIVKTTAHEFDGNFPLEMLRTSGGHGKIILPTSSNVQAKIVKRGQVDFHFHDQFKTETLHSSSAKKAKHF